MENEKSENKEENKKELKTQMPPLTDRKSPKSKEPIYLTLVLVLGIALITSIFIFNKTCPTGFFTNIPANEVGIKTINFINENLATATGEKADFISTVKENGMYKVNILYEGKVLSVYVSPDGKLLFTTPINMSVKKESKNKTAEISKTEIPNVKLFVMSFCPFGQLAENSIVPVLELLKDKINFELHFIVNVQNDKVISLHGDREAQEDMRQACIIKKFNYTKWLEYIKEFNGKCSSSNVDTCWKDVAAKVQIDTKIIEDCVNKEGIDLMKAEQAETEAYNVRGSPTLLINGFEYSGERTPEAYKTAICAAFTSQPSECQTNLSQISRTSNSNSKC